MVHALARKTMVFLKTQWLSFNLIIIIFSFENDFRNTNDVPEKNCQKERLEANGIKIQKKKKIADSKSTGSRGSSRNACAHSHVVHSPDFLFLLFYQFCIVTIFHLRAC
jgi:hypothetical protein